MCPLRICYILFIAIGKCFLLTNGQMEEAINTCPENHYWRNRYKNCYDCSNICSTKIMSRGDACKESCPNWRPHQLVTTAITTESSDLFEKAVVNNKKQWIGIGIGIGIISTVIVVVFVAYLCCQCRKLKEATVNMELSTSVMALSKPIQESMLHHETSWLLTDTASPDLSIIVPNTESSTGSTIQPNVQYSESEETSLKTSYRNSSIDNNVDSRHDSVRHFCDNSPLIDRAAEVSGNMLGQSPLEKSADGSIGRQENHFHALDDGTIITLKNLDEKNMNEFTFKEPVIKLHS